MCENSNSYCRIEIVLNIDIGHRLPLGVEPRAVARLHLRDAKGKAWKVDAGLDII